VVRAEPQRPDVELLKARLRTLIDSVRAELALAPSERSTQAAADGLKDIIVLCEEALAFAEDSADLARASLDGAAHRVVDEWSLSAPLTNEVVKAAQSFRR